MRWTALALLLSGCASGYREMRSTLPANQSAAFEACYGFVQGRACPDPGPYGSYAASCMTNVAGQYSRLPDVAARRTFLVQVGCPAPIVAQHIPAG